MGWGVWCTREAFDEECRPLSASEEGTNGGGTADLDQALQSVTPRSAGLGRVRVFCWGEVVEHVYLLLYVASRSRIRKVGAVWVDADEEVVIRA